MGPTYVDVVNSSDHVEEGRWRVAETGWQKKNTAENVEYLMIAVALRERVMKLMV